jgi:hypothetical protein
MSVETTLGVLLVIFVVICFILAKRVDTLMRNLRYERAEHTYTKASRENWINSVNVLRDRVSGLLASNKSDRDDLFEVAKQRVAAQEERDTYITAFDVAFKWLHRSNERVQRLGKEMVEIRDDFRESVEDMDNLLSTLNNSGVHVAWQQGSDGNIIPFLNFEVRDGVANKQRDLAMAPAPAKAPEPRCVSCGETKENCVGYRSGNGFKTA